MAQADISAAQTTTMVDRTLGVKTWDMAAVVRGWLSSPSTNYGLLLNPDTNKVDRSRTFASAQDATASRRPFLRITYTMPVAATNSSLVSGATLTPDAGVSATTPRDMAKEGKFFL